MDDWKLKTTGR